MPAKSSGGWIPSAFMSAFFVEASRIAASGSVPTPRFIPLPQRRRTVRILREFVLGKHDILFYVKSSPASRLYLALHRKWKDGRITIGSVESQSDLRNEPTIAPEAVHLWERTVLRCDYLFSNSRAVQQSLQREYNLRSEVVPTGVDTKFFTPTGTARPILAPEFCLWDRCGRSNSHNCCWRRQSVFPRRILSLWAKV